METFPSIEDLYVAQKNSPRGST